MVESGESTPEERWVGLTPYPIHMLYRPAQSHIGHQQHLCFMAESGSVPLDQIKELVRNPKFICRKCGRVAAHEENLCEPVPL
jgi:hypothetical protein